jgi:two-component system LytT family response regulator
MSAIRTLIVDDEPLARKSLRLLLQQDRDIEIVGECKNGMETVKQIREKSPELVFLDIQMPQMDGLDVVRTIGIEKMPAVVFVTAYDKYAVEAFETQALDYLLKPFDDTRFHRALRRAKASLHRKGMETLAVSLSRLLNDNQSRRDSRRSRARVHGQFSSHLLITMHQKLLFLKTDEVDWIGAADYCAEVHTHDKTYLHRETMNELERKLDPSKFFRIHRSAIVNLGRVRELQPHPGGRYVVVLLNGTTLNLSRDRRNRLKELL